VAKGLPGHEVKTTFGMGWSELENGDLLNAAEIDGFELLIICDKNMRYQQNVRQRKMAILELWTNHRPTLEKHFAYIKTNAESMTAGEYRELKAP
jgi:hypothetical protein